MRCRSTIVLGIVISWAAASAGAAEAQQDPAVALYDDFLRQKQRFPELPENWRECRDLNPVPFILAAERLFAYLQVSQDDDPRLANSLQWLERAAALDCLALYDDPAGAEGERGDGSSIGGGSSLVPTTLPEISGQAKPSALGSRQELEDALAHIAKLEADLRTAVAERDGVVAGYRESQDRAARRIEELQDRLNAVEQARARQLEASAEARQYETRPTDRRGCWFGTATNGAEMRHGWLCLYDGEVEGPGLGLGSPVATFLSFAAATGELGSWLGHPLPAGPDPRTVEFGPRRNENQMTGSLTIQADGQIVGSLDLGPRRVLDFRGGRIR